MTNDQRINMTKELTALCAKYNCLNYAAIVIEGNGERGGLIHSEVNSAGMAHIVKQLIPIIHSIGDIQQELMIPCK